MRRRDLLGGLSLVPLAAPAVAQCVVATFPRINLADRCEGGDANPPSLDLTFMVPGSLDPRITFTRASTGTYFDSAGVMQTAAINAPRWDYDPTTLALRGLLLEDQRTNLLLNSATLSTQSVTVTAVAHTLSFYGTGTITKSGTATGALVGTGVGQRVTQTFTPTAGSLTCTVTGTVSNAQLEASTFPTSYIATAGSTVTRAQDKCTIPSANMTPWFNAPVGSWFAEFITFGSAGSNARVLGAPVAPGGGITQLFTNPALLVSQYDGAAAISVANAITANTISKASSSWAAGTGKVCANGGAVVSGAEATGFAALATSGVGLFTVSNPGLTDNASGHIRAVRYWRTVLSDADMRSLTS